MKKHFCLTFPVLCLGLVFSSSAFASGTACATSAPGDELDLFPSTNVPAYGCTDVDIQLSNFSVVAGGANNESNVPTISDVNLFGGGSLGALTANFDTPGVNNWSVASADTTGQIDSIVSFVATATGAPIDQLGIPLIPADFSGTSGVLTITESYCLGETTVSGCPAGQLGSFEVEVVGDSISFNSGPSLITPSTMIAISDEIELQAGETLNYLPIEMDEAVPEPATFALLGSGILGVLLFRRRKA